MTAIEVTDEARVEAVAHALLQFDGHEPKGPRLGAAIMEASRIVLAVKVLATLERDVAVAVAATSKAASSKRRPARRPVEH